MADEIIKELRQMKDRMAREHGYDIDALVAHLQTTQQVEGRRVVDLRATKQAATEAVSARQRSSQGRRH